MTYWIGCLTKVITVIDDNGKDSHEVACNILDVENEGKNTAKVNNRSHNLIIDDARFTKD